MQSKYRSRNFGLSDIITDRLSQDILENLFAASQAMGRTNDKPAAFDYEFRLRLCILGWNAIGALSNNTNTLIDNSDDNLVDLNAAFDKTDDHINSDKLEKLTTNFGQENKVDVADAFEASLKKKVRTDSKPVTSPEFVEEELIADKDASYAEGFVIKQKIA